MASAADVIRWGIIGCGDVTEKKSGPGFQRAAHSELVAVMRRDAAKAQDYAQRHSVARWYSTVKELLEDDAVDAIYVATPPGSHLELALQVLAARKPCYMEKPMARNYKESLQMYEAFRDAGVPLFVAYYRRAYPRYQRLKQFLESGSLGELSAVHYTLRRRSPAGGGVPTGWRHDVSGSGGGLFVDVGSHLLDLLDFLLGPLREVQGSAARSQDAACGSPEDAVSMSFVAGQSAVGSATWNFRASSDIELLEIVGSRGSATLLDPMNGTACTIEYSDGSASEHWEVPPPAPAVQEPLIQLVVDAIRTGNPGVCPSTGESALRTAEHIDSVLAGFYGGREDSFWLRPETWQPEVARALQEAHEVLLERDEAS